jgi:hypothetical protein
MNRTALAALLFVFGLSALAPFDAAQGKQDGKTELRYALKKGDKFLFRLKHSVTVKLDKVPELLQGILSDDPVAVAFDGAVDMEVTDVSETGTALISGAWKTAKAKGHILVNDIDFDFDAAKKVEAKPKKKEDPDDPAVPGFADFQDLLEKMVQLPLKLSVDNLGTVSFRDGSGKLGQIESAFRTLNGMMGPLPKDKVGKGDSWKDEIKFGMPGVGNTLEIKIRTVNTVESLGKVDGVDCAVIKSKFAVGKLPGEKDDAPPADALGPKIKTDGGGDATTVFSIAAGRAAKATSALRIKVSAAIPNPGGGEEMDLKAQLKVDTQTELGGK